MLAEPAVSIVLPYRNSAKTLERAITSILKQDFSNWELIGINDHSEDFSEKIIESYKKSDSRIKSLQNKGKGIVSALNHGIEEAMSEIIIRMDADDAMMPERIGEQVHHLEANPETGLVSSLVSYVTDFNLPGEGRGYALYVDWINKLTSSDQIKLHRFEESPLAHPSVAFRKSIVQKCGGYKEGNFPEDYELWLRWLSKGVRMEKIKRSLIDWHDSGERLSRQDQRYSLDAFQRIKAEYLSIWLNHNSLTEKKLSAWGIGKVAKRQIQHLLRHNLKIEKYYEVNPKKIGSVYKGSPVFHFKEIDTSKEELILVLYCARTAKAEINKFLKGKNLELGKDFIFLG